MSLVSSRCVMSRRHRRRRRREFAPSPRRSCTATINDTPGSVSRRVRTRTRGDARPWQFRLGASRLSHRVGRSNRGVVRLSTRLGVAPCVTTTTRYGTVRRGATRARKKHRNAFPSFSAPARPLPPSSLVPPRSLSPFSSFASSPKSSCGSSPRDKIASRLSRLLLPRGCYSGVSSGVPHPPSPPSRASLVVAALGCRFHAFRERATDRPTDRPSKQSIDRPASARIMGLTL